MHIVQYHGRISIVTCYEVCTSNFDTIRMGRNEILIEFERWLNNL